jgi:hypothetical protein
LRSREVLAASVCTGDVGGRVRLSGARSRALISIAKASRAGNEEQHMALGDARSEIERRESGRGQASGQTMTSNREQSP